jgi:hypothetical protein
VEEAVVPEEYHRSWAINWLTFVVPGIVVGLSVGLYTDEYGTERL